MSLSQIVWLEFDYMNKHYEGEAIPAPLGSNKTAVPAYDIYFNNEYTGTIIKEGADSISTNFIDNNMVKIITHKLAPYLIRTVEV